MMRRSRAVVFAASGALLVAAVGTATAQAQSTTHAAPNAQAMAATSASSLVATRPAALHASAHDAFVRHSVITAAGGLQYVPYDRTYQGLPVVGGDFVVATDSAGKVLDTSVAQDQTINLATTTPAVTAKQAETTAASSCPPWTVVSRHPAGRLRARHAAARLADHRRRARAPKAPAGSTVEVDAQTGKVLHTQEHVMRRHRHQRLERPTRCTLATTHSGSAPTRMKDPVTNNLSCQDAANNTTFSGSDDIWGNGTASNRETGCVDALFAAQTENKMLSQWLGRNGLDGNGGGWPIRVGLNDENAYYDGTQVQIGHNTAGGWIGSIDVVAHEHGHGIDDHTPGGISGKGTQEFVADIFGASTEWFANEPHPGPRRTSWSASRSTWSAPARSATCTTRRRWATRTATPAPSPTVRCTPRPVPATTGSTWSPRAPTRPTASRPARPATARRSPASVCRTP